MNTAEYSPGQLLGPLNEVEQKYAPEKLYVAGNTTFLQEGARVSIVGSRAASLDGIARAKKLATALVDRGIVVVSGLAEGIDTAAHTTAIQQGGKTIAVIGTPLESVYPKSNTALQARIAQEHLLVSQYPAGYPVRKHNFPQRNRVMALLSDATVIIEASDTSGSLSQGWEALRLGRGLFITRSVAENRALTWPAKLMSYGAQVLSDETLSEFLDLLPERAPDVLNEPTPF